jgi:hypothetical protein
VQGLNRRGSFLHGTLTQWFPTQKSPSFLHVPEDASMGTASRCSTIVFAPAVSASIECIISLRFVCVLTSATIKSAPPIMFFLKYFQKWCPSSFPPKTATSKLAASRRSQMERGALECRVERRAHVLDWRRLEHSHLHLKCHKAPSVVISGRSAAISGH